MKKIFFVFLLLTSLLLSTSTFAYDVVKKSTSGICHDKKSQYYAKTKNFKSYKTMKECLDSGGRLPKK
jgi:hypothetical protein